MTDPTPAAPWPQPLDTSVTPRFAGLPTFMRLPVMDPADVDVALIGVPFDGGVTNRAGTRHGPRELRNQSSLVRRHHHVTGRSPYDLVRVADCGDCPTHPLDLMESLRLIEAHYAGVAKTGAIPITGGGDHLVTLPILRGLSKGAAVGLIQFDAHSDTYDSFFGQKYNHGTPFRRAIEEGLVDPRRMVQIGLRGSVADPASFDFARAAGVRMIFIEEFVARGVDDVMDEARAILGDGPTYVSFDIDAIDPSQAPGTGTPEIGGLSTREAQALVRRLAGLDVVGADLVEVAPPFDPSGLTAMTGATVMFELLCVVADSLAARGG
ncbi:guanidinopropionase [Methylopila capsulata]|uniref:Guanidinopropionase n=1 Tax=Methylopila capsulata TaxID=61654 RepID=A0A9W6ITF1_9HYPH|nr:agmatinase [Methylopila capsulata]MBM7850882.1 guanidinopropionase [Methylopila capsulata]GLK56178.1 guanidinopropionase [Methylopila capsulata]